MSTIGNGNRDRRADYGQTFFLQNSLQFSLGWEDNKFNFPGLVNSKGMKESADTEAEPQADETLGN